MSFGCTGEHRSAHLRFKYAYELLGALNANYRCMATGSLSFSEKLLSYVCACAYPLNSKDVELSFVKKETQPLCFLYFLLEYAFLKLFCICISKYLPCGVSVDRRGYWIL